jgi:ubiquinone biosynthesis protein
VFRTIKNLYRLIGIMRTLARYDAVFPLEKLDLPDWAVRGLSFLAGRASKKYADPRPGERLAMALQEQGPSFIKFGQSLSTRSDLIGEEVAQDLAGLRDRLPPFSIEDARKTIESEFEQPLDALYATFDAEPVAAASIAQVHFATTTTGEEVAVKILRPGIEEAFQRDLDLYYWVAEVIETLQPGFRRLRPVEVVRTFQESVDLEMDLRLEAAAASELSDAFEHDPDFGVPLIDWNLTQRRVMTIERIHGISIADHEALETAGLDKDKLASNLLVAFLKQVFRDGFFHADLHPGNLFANDEGRILAVDFGIMGRLDRQTRLFVAELLLAFVTGNWKRAAEIHFEAGYVPRNKSVDVFAQACRSIGEPLMGRAASEISIGRLLAQLFQITETFSMQTQPQLLLLQKTLVVVEGVCRDLSPETNFFEAARPFLTEWVRENLGPEARIKDAVVETAAAARRIPQILDRAEQATEFLNAAGFAMQNGDHADKLSPQQQRQGNGFSARRRGMPSMIVIVMLVAVIAILLFRG